MVYEWFMKFLLSKFLYEKKKQRDEYDIDAFLFHLSLYMKMKDNISFPR